MTSLLSLLIAIAITMIVVNYYLSEADSIMQGVTLGVFSIMYLILVILMTRSFLNEVYLIIFSYIVLASFFGIEVSVVVVVVVDVLVLTSSVQVLIADGEELPS